MGLGFNVLRLGGVGELVPVLGVFVGWNGGVFRTTRGDGSMAACGLSYHLACDEAV